MLTHLRSWLHRVYRHREPEPSPYMESILIYRSLPPSSHTVYSSVYRIPSMYSSIDIYIEVIDRAYTALKEDKYFKEYIHTEISTPVTLREFYLNREGRMIDVALYHSRFIKDACSLLHLYEEKESNKPSSVALEQSKQRILRIVNNLIFLSKSFKEIFM